MAAKNSYSGAQIFLHWLIVLLIVFQYIANGLVRWLWNARVTGALPDEPTLNTHVTIGIAVFALTGWRLWLRFRDGAPPPPENEVALARLIGRGFHVLFYLALFALPLAGAAGWFFSQQWAIDMHKLLKDLLLPLIALHVIGTFIQQYAFKNHIFMRMIGRV